MPSLMPLAELCPALEWSAEDFRECFRSVDTIGKVVTVDGGPIGFVVYKLDHQMQEVFLKNIAVRAEWQRRGAGRALIRSLDSKLSQSYERITAIVPESNLPGLYLLRDCGYLAVRVLRGWFGDEDAYVMQKTRVDESREQVL
jgi:ribosomal protein S18 acetylase RimI-like enzyme